MLKKDNLLVKNYYTCNARVIAIFNLLNSGRNEQKAE